MDWGYLGGAERQAILLARLLRDRQGADVHVWSLGNECGAAELALRHGIPYRTIGVPADASYLTTIREAVKLAWAMRKFRPTVLMPYALRSSVLCGLIWRWTGARTCVWNQRSELSSRHAVSRLVRYAARRTPCFVSNARHTAQRMQAQLRLPDSRMHVVYNGVDLPDAMPVKAQARRQYDIPEDAFAVGMLANVTHRKDHRTLIDAWGRVRAIMEPSGKKPVLYLAGRLDSVAHEIKALAFDAGHCGSIRFLGAVDDTLAFAAAMDLCVHSSISEGLPNAVLECMAVGAPVVVTDIPGHREALGDAYDDVFIRCGDAEQLANSIIQIERNPGQREQYGRRNAERVRAIFSTDSLYRCTLDVIETALGVR